MISAIIDHSLVQAAPPKEAVLGFANNQARRASISIKKAAQVSSPTVQLYCEVTMREVKSEWANPTSPWTR
jgi:hypothetical protein